MIQWAVLVEFNITNQISIYFLSSVSLKENWSGSCKHTNEKFWKAAVLIYLLFISIWNFYINIVIAYIYIAPVCLPHSQPLATIKGAASITEFSTWRSLGAS